MTIQATFYHAGCPVCVSAEHALANGLDREQYAVEMVHLGEDRSRIEEAERAGIESVPALVIEGRVYHINFGAAVADLK